MCFSLQKAIVCCSEGDGRILHEKNPSTTKRVTLSYATDLKWLEMDPGRSAVSKMCILRKQDTKNVFLTHVLIE